MARARSIKPSFFSNEDLAKLPAECRLLFIGLWCLADREGRLEDRPIRIKAAIFPYEDVDVSTYLDTLQASASTFLTRYEHEVSPGLFRKYIQITNFKKHQHPHHKEVDSEIPELGKCEHLPRQVLAPEIPVPARLVSGTLNPEPCILNPVPSSARSAPGESVTRNVTTVTPDVTIPRKHRTDAEVAAMWQAAGWGGPEQFQAWWVDVVSKHPNPKANAIAERLLIEYIQLGKPPTRDEFEQGYARDALSWRKGFAPNLFDFLSDKRWRFSGEAVDVLPNGKPPRKSRIEQILENA